MPVKGWIEVNENYCKGCSVCIENCPQAVMGLDTSTANAKRIPSGAPDKRGLHRLCYLRPGLPRGGFNRLSRSARAQPCAQARYRRTRWLVNS